MRNTDKKRGKIENGYRLSPPAFWLRAGVIGFCEHLHPPFLHSARMQGGEPPNNEHRAGLTLIEVMVVVAILAVISSTLFSLFNTSLFSQRRGTNKALVYSEARAALDMMSREIEKAFIDERAGSRAGAKCWGLDGTGGNPDTFLFIAPLNPDNENSGTYKGDLNEVGYWVKNSELIKGWSTGDNDFDFDSNNDSVLDVSDLGSTNPLIGNVFNLQFEYFGFSASQWGWLSHWHDLGGNPLPFLPRAIKITLVIQYEMEKDNIEHDTFIAVVNIPGSGQ